MEAWLAENLHHGLYIGLIVTLVLCGIGLPIPEEIVFLAAGYAVQEIGANLWIACGAGVIGIILGDSIPFLLGKHHGNSLLKIRPFSRMLSEERLHSTRTFFKKHGSKTIFAARFVAGVRIPAFFIAATMGVRYRVFVFWDGLGAMISCPVSIILAYYFGKAAEKYLKEFKFVALIVVGVLIVIYLIFHLYWTRRKAAGLRMQKAESIKEETKIIQAPRT